MAIRKNLITLSVVAMILVAVSIGLEESVADIGSSAELICTMNTGDTIRVGVDTDSFEVGVDLNILVDSVAGFQLWLFINDPEFIRFDVDSSWILVDTLCIGFDTVNQICTLYRYDTIDVATTRFDTSGTLVGGWEFVEARALENGGFLKVSGTAETGGPPIVSPLPPQYGTLVKVTAGTNGVLGDSICDSVFVGISFNQSETFFSNGEGDVIGCNYNLYVDTFYFNCAQWDSGVCVAWFDTVYDTIWHCDVDTSKVILVNNTIAFNCCDWVEGDANGDTFINITDAVYIVQYIFANGPEPVPNLLAGDANCDSLVNISDSVFIVQYIFAGGPAPPCLCQNPI